MSVPDRRTGGRARKSPAAAAPAPARVDVIVMGEPMAEFVAEPGGQQYRHGHGGDASNFAVAAARQGVRAAIATRLGCDAFGDGFMDLWQREGVGTGLVLRDPDHPTAVYFVSPLVSGHAFTYYRAGSAASHFAAGDLPDAALDGVHFLHATGITQAISTASCDAVFSAIERARARGVKVSYDTNLRLKLWDLPRARAIVNETVRLCDVCLPSLDDARLLTGLEDADAIADVFLKLGAPLVALKLGAEGCLVATPDGRRRVPGIRVDSVDATGAGDTFGGAFVAGLVQGSDPYEAARYANAAAGLSTRGYGAVAPIPRRAEVLEALSAQSK